jgi:molybdate transport system substrate-binding protein
MTTDAVSLTPVPPAMTTSTNRTGGHLAAPVLTIMVPEAFRKGFEPLAAAFCDAGSARVVLVGGPAGGAAPEAINNRIKAGDHFDVALLPHGLLQAHADAGRVMAESRMDVMRSLIGLCVAPGRDCPVVIDTVEALKSTLLAASAIALSTAGSGEYVAGALLDRLGIADQVRPRCVRVTAVPVGEYVTQGLAPIGFQQVSELLQVEGIRFGGYLPGELQQATLISAGVSSASQNLQAALHFLAFLRSEPACAMLRASGVEPVSAA